jgi:diguanylate cyclase (GGDEF)-like protein
MSAAQKPPDEDLRLAALRHYHLLDTPAEAQFDGLTQLAAYICQTPIALISLIDSDRQWFKSRHGLDVCETGRDEAFCAHAILQPDDLLVVPEAHNDPRFADNPLVIGEPFIRFYAGMPLLSHSGYPIGTLCVIDSQPRHLSIEQQDALRILGRQVIAQCELHLRVQQLEELSEQQARYEHELEGAKKSLELLNAQLHKQSHTDTLTGVPNRRSFEENLAHECLRAERNASPFSLLVVDVDHFKAVNDNYGHPVGDKVLIDVAQALLHAARGSDLVSRYGGEEFAVLLPDTDAAGAMIMAERLRLAVQEATRSAIPVTVSIGIDTSPLTDIDGAKLFANADDALLAAKQRGRNCSVAWAL